MQTVNRQNLITAFHFMLDSAMTTQDQAREHQKKVLDSGTRLGVGDYVAIMKAEADAEPWGNVASDTEEDGDMIRAVLTERARCEELLHTDEALSAFPVSAHLTHCQRQVARRFLHDTKAVNRLTAQATTDRDPCLVRRAETAEERLRLIHDALLADGYFTPDEIGPDLAPRVTEVLSHHRQRAEQAETARERVQEAP